MTGAACPLCVGVAGALVFQGEQYRVIRADEPGFPAFYRLIWTAHVAEFSDLDRADRRLCMEAVNVVERVLRAQLQPTKINLATLGNMVPHLHWHVIARFAWDSHFPAPVWAPAQRAVDALRLTELSAKLSLAEEIMRRELARLGESPID